MKRRTITRATLGRLPLYLKYLRSSADEDEMVSATAIAKALKLGEVQVRKDLNDVSGKGRPRIGYLKKELIKDLEHSLGYRSHSSAVIVGAGKLGTALLQFDGFSLYGLEIAAAFDCDKTKTGKNLFGKTVYPLDELRLYCQMHDIHIGIITVPEASAQSVCNAMTDAGITAIWNFAPVELVTAENVIVQQEDLALSLAHLNMLINNK